MSQVGGARLCLIRMRSSGGPSAEGKQGGKDHADTTGQAESSSMPRLTQATLPSHCPLRCRRAIADTPGNGQGLRTSLACSHQATTQCPVGARLRTGPLGLLLVTLPLGRFSGRGAPFQVPERVPHEGVPEHLQEPLRRWIYAALEGGGAELVALKLEIRIDYDRAGGNAALFLTKDPQPYELLAIVNAILANGGPWPGPLATDRRGTNSNAAGKAQLREDLIILLAAGSSVWQVSNDGSGLTRRVDETSAGAADRAASAAEDNPKSGSAAKQIRGAWRAIYELEPAPETAYREAVKAVESAAHAVVQPNHAGATLGSMLGELRANAARWTLAIPGKDGSGDIAPLLAMIGLLWDGQEWRHGSQKPARDATPEEAEMAVHLAVTLVHWFATGAVHKR